MNLLPFVKMYKKLVNRYYSQIQLNIIFTTNFKIYIFFRFKDRIPESIVIAIRLSMWAKPQDTCQPRYLNIYKLTIEVT